MSARLHGGRARKHFRERQFRERHSRERLGQTAIVVGIGAVLAAIGLFATGEYVATRWREPTVASGAAGILGTGPASAVAIAATPGDSVIYRGSILFMPEYGHTCRQLFFNNLTGRLSDNGKVDCLAVLTDLGFAPPQEPNARFRVISDSFRH